MSTNNIDRIGTQLLRYCLKDVVLVAIDFENGAAICGAPLTPATSVGSHSSREEFDAQAGVAILVSQSESTGILIGGLLILNIIGYS